MKQTQAKPTIEQSGLTCNLISNGSLRWFFLIKAGEEACQRGNLEEAEQFWWLALRAAELEQGTAGRGVFACLDYLGHLFQRTGRHDGALQLMLESLRIKIVIFGEKHLTVALALARLAPAYEACGQTFASAVVRSKYTQLIDRSTNQSPRYSISFQRAIAGLLDHGQVRGVGHSR